jgi:peptidoglycan/LPS O-acetylase OafA/YrhL
MIGHYALTVSYTVSLSVVLVFTLGIAMYVIWRILDLKSRGFPQQLLLASIVVVLVLDVLLGMVLDHSSPGLRLVGNYVLTSLLIVGIALLVVRPRLGR